MLRPSMLSAVGSSFSRVTDALNVRNTYMYVRADTTG